VTGSVDGEDTVRRLLIALVVLVGLLVAADRVGVVLAQRALATQIRTELALQQTPDVSIRGIPFLTQAIRGRYQEVGVVLPDVDSGPLQNMAVDARLFGVRASLGDVLRRRIDAVPVDRITGEVTIGYDDLARASGIPGLRIVRDGDGLRVSGTVEVLGRQVDASAVGRVEVAGNDIAITAERAEVAGVDLPQPALDVAARLLSFRVSPRDLPLDLRITGVRSGDEALLVGAESDAVVLRR
jgi:LmeA-like phospholipid-binding